MRKNGIIPPHFVFYIENDGIEITEYKAGNLTRKDPYDRMVVKFPYSIRNLEIQVIFDKLDYSTPPDFVLINCETIVMNYKEIIKDWNFRDSSSLYKSLHKIKVIYSQEQEKKLKELITSTNENYIDVDVDISNLKDINGIYNKIGQEPSSTNIFEWIEKLMNFLKNRFNSYVNKANSNNLEILINYGKHTCVNTEIQSKNNMTEIPKDTIVISYPIDYPLRSRNIPRQPMVNIYIPISYEMHFHVDVVTSYFVNVSDFKFQSENVKLKNFYAYLVKFESLLVEYLKEMQLRESVVSKILDAGIGFPLEIDTYGFYKMSLYFHYNKNDMSIANSSLKFKGTSSLSSFAAVPLQLNLILNFNFSKDEYHKIEMVIIDSDKLGVLIKKKFEYSSNERDLNNLVHQILQSVLGFLNPKKN